MVTIQTRTILALHTSSPAFMELCSMSRVPAEWFITGILESAPVKFQIVSIIALGLDRSDIFPMSCMP